MCGDDDIIM